MTLTELVKLASNKTNFTDLSDYIEFGQAFWDFTAKPGAIQAEIVSRNETQYRFLHFKEDGSFNITRPLNYNLLYPGKTAKTKIKRFLGVLDDVKASPKSVGTPTNRELVNRAVYTIQQAIGASLDALPAGKSNTARKISGDLFERFIRLNLVRVGIDCIAGQVKVPIEVDGKVEFFMSYQHDLVIKFGTFVKIIGSVKTSSKDRLDKIFIDKFLLAKLTGKDVPHVAIFLNDVQRKGKTPKEYGINSTFLPGRFKGYTIKLNPLDGVYYFDMRPNMGTENILKDHIRTFDHFLFSDLCVLLNRTAVVAKIEPREEESGK